MSSNELPTELRSRPVAGHRSGEYVFFRHWYYFSNSVCRCSDFSRLCLIWRIKKMLNNENRQLLSTYKLGMNFLEWWRLTLVHEQLSASVCCSVTESLLVATVTSTPGSFQITEVHLVSERLSSKTRCLTQQHRAVCVCVCVWDPGCEGTARCNSTTHTHTHISVCVSAVMVTYERLWRHDSSHTWQHLNTTRQLIRFHYQIFKDYL